MEPYVSAIHMTREDPIAAGLHQVWRGWITVDSLGNTLAVTEEGQYGKSLKRVELAPEQLGGRSPTGWLASQIDSRQEQGWKTTFVTEDPVFSTDKEIMFEIKAARSTNQVGLIKTMIAFFNKVGSGYVEWLKPSDLEELDRPDPPGSWSTEVQLGRHRITVSKGRLNRRILHGAATMDFTAQKILSALIAGLRRGSWEVEITMLLADLTPIDQGRSRKMESLFPLPEWLKDAAYDIGAAQRPLSPVPTVDIHGVDLGSVVF